MSAFVMVLAAGMAVGNGPEKVSGEVEPGLDLHGKWAGSIGIEPGFTPPASYEDGRLTVIRPDGPHSATLKLIDQGEGKCKCRIAGDEALGIYQWKGQQLVLCIGRHEKRPSTFRLEDGLLFTLRPVR
jgi:hypothetical protein